VFEIGLALREARERRGVTLADAEGATRIRARYLVLLEQERFAELPGEAYARSFLREYGEFLGLDGQQLSAEYELRFAAPEPAYVEPVSFSGRGWPARRWLLVLVPPIVVAVIVLAVVVPGGGRRAVPPPPATKPAPAPAPRPAQPAARPPPRPALPHLQLVAARGDCWLEIHAGSQRGPLLYEGILARGGSLAFVRRFLWIRIGAPSSLVVHLNGKQLPLPQTSAPLNVQFSLRQLHVVP
jgi:Helix-turn-helix domain/RodZ C-terminal domain